MTKTDKFFSTLLLAAIFGLALGAPGTDGPEALVKSTVEDVLGGIGKTKDKRALR